MFHTQDAEPKNCTILFVDDEERALHAIRRLLHGADSNWKILTAVSVSAAMEALESEPVDIVVTDIMMPDRSGFDLIAAISTSDALKHIPVLVFSGASSATLKRQAMEAGAIDLINKPTEREDLIARIRSVLRLKQYQDSLARMNEILELEVHRRTRDLRASRTDVLLCLAIAGECRDNEPSKHLTRVARYTRLLARGLSLSEGDIELITMASPLHDIGKIGIPEAIVRKPGILTDAERAVMQTHCLIGHRILTPPAALANSIDDSSDATDRPINPLLVAGAEIALNHHERWDGRGYPNKVAGAGIPISARIVAVADVYDALTTRRSYKPASSHIQAMNALIDAGGKHFDPEVIQVLQTVQLEFEQTMNAWGDSMIDGGSLAA